MQFFKRTYFKGVVDQWYYDDDNYQEDDFEPRMINDKDCFHPMFNKTFYLGINFRVSLIDSYFNLNISYLIRYLLSLKANFYEAVEFCRYHNMFLATINSQEENDVLLAIKEKLGKKYI